MGGADRLDPLLEQLAREIEAYLRAHDLPETPETVAAVLTGGNLVLPRRSRAAGGRAPRRAFTVSVRWRNGRSTPK